MNNQLFEFIKNSPTAFHATNNIKDDLLKNGFIELNEKSKWELKKEHKYFVTRNDSSIIAFTIPNNFNNVQITASHLDSPTFKIKDNGELKEKIYTKLNVEKYGGMIMSSWFDRPLSIAGRVVCVEDNKIVTRLVNIDRDLLMIPNVAAHLKKDSNEYNVQKELLPIITQEQDDFSLIDFILDECDVAGEVKGADLFLYNRQVGMKWGAKDEYFSAPRIDNLECTFALVQSLIDSKNQDSLNMCLMFDNEEVGSSTKQGADSTFLGDTLLRIKECFNLSNQDYLMMISKGFMVSADNAHAYHPNYGELYDLKNHPFMNKGIVIKHNANQKYTSDAVSVAVFKHLCDQSNVPYQDYHNNSNQPGGSTLGNISNTQISLNTVDIGLAQLGMHSAFETAGSKDLDHLIKAITYFYNHMIGE